MQTHQETCEITKAQSDGVVWHFPHPLFALFGGVHLQEMVLISQSFTRRSDPASVSNKGIFLAKGALQPFDCSSELQAQQSGAISPHIY